MSGAEKVTFETRQDGEVIKYHETIDAIVERQLGVGIKTVDSASQDENVLGCLIPLTEPKSKRDKQQYLAAFKSGELFLVGLAGYFADFPGDYNHLKDEYKKRFKPGNGNTALVRDLSLSPNDIIANFRLNTDLMMFDYELVTPEKQDKLMPLLQKGLELAHQRPPAESEVVPMNPSQQAFTEIFSPFRQPRT